jgi:hypothetical protein
MSEDMGADQEDELLQARLAKLEAENEELRTHLEEQPSDVDGQAPGRAGRGRGWTALASVLIVLGCLLAPLAVVSGWAKSTLSDTDSFVATYAPLARDPEVQTYVVDQVTAVINQNVDIDQLTSDVLDGIKALGTRPAASAALDALKEPASQGLQTVIRNGVTGFVTSDAFAQSWERSLRTSHSQLVAILTNDPQALVAAQSDGTIGIQLGPIVEDVKRALIARGLAIAARIPAVNRTIPIALSDQIATAQTGYRIIVAVGSWLPWVALLFLAAGVLVARRRSVALVFAALGLSLAALVLMLGLTVGRIVLQTSIPSATIPANVLTIFYDTATAAMRDTAIATLVLALSVAVVGWLGGPFRRSRSLRSLYTAGVTRLRHNVEEHGVTTGRTGNWVYAQRRILHVLIAVAASAAILLLRPLTAAVILWTLVIAVLALIIVSLVERPEQPVPPEPDSEPAAA